MKSPVSLCLLLWRQVFRHMVLISEPPALHLCGLDACIVLALMRAYVLFVWVLFSLSAFGETGGAERGVLRAAIICYQNQMLLCTVLSGIQS
jgi:hypothetical protein